MLSASIQMNVMQPKNGVEEAPKALLEAGLEQQLHGLGWTVFDHSPADSIFAPQSGSSDKPSMMGKLKNVPEVARVTRAVSDAVFAVHKQGAIALTIGGDHSLGVGTVSGTVRAFRDKSEVAVIWVDAHAVWPRGVRWMLMR